MLNERIYNHSHSIYNPLPTTLRTKKNSLWEEEESNVLTQLKRNKASRRKAKRQSQMCQGLAAAQMAPVAAIPAPIAEASTTMIGNTECRAAIDVGSGSTKVCIANVDTVTNKIIQILFEQSFAVPYQAYLESSEENKFNDEIKHLGTHTFSQIQNILKEHQVARIAAVATEAFRKASNGVEFAKEIEDATGIPLSVISQKEEGQLAFHSAVAASKSDPEELLIWDIGTGSFQMSANYDDELIVYMKSTGSVPFRNYIIETIQGKDPTLVNSPNPISEEDWEKADAFAREIGRKALPLIKEKIKNLEGSVVGIGRLFANSVMPIGSENGSITRKDLRAFIREGLNKTDEELNDPFANVNLANCMLVLGVMKGLHIHEIKVVETTSTKGMLEYTPYWA